jgi:tape measure domain-containing protein
MATTRKEVELRITANDLGNKSLEDLLKTFHDLKTAQEDFAKSGDTSTKSLRELKQDLNDLRAIGQQLASRGALIDSFEKTATAVDLAAKKVEEARQRLQAFQATQKEGETLSRKQASEYANLQKSLASAEKGFTSATTRAAALQAQLKTIGSGDTDAAKAGLISFASQVGESLKNSESSIRSYDAALRIKREGEESAVQTTAKLAEAQREALAMNKAFDEKAGFNKVGHDALVAANAVDVLTRDFEKLAASGVRGGDGIRAILNPSQEAIKTLSGLETEIAAVNAKLDSAKTDNALRNEIKGLRSEYLGLASDAGKAASQIADDIGKYKTQEGVVNDLRERFVVAREAVLQFANQVAKANAPTDELKRSLGTAQAELASVATQVERESAAFAKLRATLNAAGVDVKNLTQSEERLKAVAVEVTSAQDKLGLSTRQVGAGAAEAGKGLSFFESNGRTSLSVVQRLRGQVLSLIAAHIGLVAAVNLVKEAVNNQNTFRSIEIGLRVVSDDDKVKATADVAYLHGLANRLGEVYVDLGKSFAKVAFAGKAAGLSDNAIKATFESFLEVSKVFHLTREEIDGVFLALQQGLSTGRVKAQDLNQLAQRLPGAFSVIAEALKQPNQSIKDFKKELSDPNKGFDSKGFVLFADTFRQKVGKELPDATKSLLSEINRLRNAINDLLNEKFGGDMESTLRRLVSRLVDFFRSDEGKKFAQGLADTFAKVFEVLRVTIDYVNEIVILLKIMTGLKVAGFFLNIAAGATAASVAGGRFATMLAGIGTLLKSLTLLSAVFFVVFQIGKYLDDQFYIVRAASNNIAESILSLMRSVPEYFTVGWEKAKAVFYSALGLIVEAVSLAMGQINTKTAGTFEALSKVPGLSALSNAAQALFVEGQKTATAFADGYAAKAKEAQKRVAESNDRIAAEMKKFQSRQMVVQLDDPRSPIKLKTGAGPGSTPTTLTDAEREQIRNELRGPTGPDKKLEALAKSLSDDVSKIIEDLDKSAQGNLEKQIEAATQHFVLLQSKLNVLAKASHSITVGDEQFSVAQVRKLIGEYEEVIKKRITEKFYQEQSAKNQKAFTDLVTESKDAIAEVDDKVAAGLITREQGLVKLAAIDFKYSDSIKKNADIAVDALRAMPAGVFEKLGGEKLISDIAKASAGVEALSAKTRENFFKKDVTTAEKTINDLLDVRRSKVELVNAEVELGLKTQLEGQAEINKINVQYSGAILENADNLVKLLQALPPDLFVKLGAEKLIADIQKSVLDVRALRTEAQKLGKQLETEFGEGMGTVVVTLGQELGKVLTHAESLGDAFRNAGRAFLQFASDFLLKIAGMIAKQAILNALQAAAKSSSSGSIFTTIATAIAGSAHGGAIIGGSGMVPREVSPAWFQNAQRFHTGGMPGLRADEVPAILLTGEEVLNKTDPRNRLNGGASGGGTRIVNVLDPDLARDFMESSAGEKIILNHIKRNGSAVKQIVG